MTKEQLRKNWRRGFAVALTAAMVINSTLPATTFATEFTAPDELVQTLSENETENTQAKDESTVFGDGEESTATEDIFSTGTENASSAQTSGTELSEAVKALQERINALPTVEEFQSMADGTTVEDSTLNQNQMDTYNEVQVISGEIEKLSKEEQGQLDISRLEALFEYFNSTTKETVTTNESVASVSGSYKFESITINKDSLNGNTVNGWAEDGQYLDQDGGFYSSEYNSTEGYLPDNGKITTSDKVPYQLSWTGDRPYVGNDSIRIVGVKDEDASKSIKSTPVTMNLSSYGVYDKVYVLGTAAAFRESTSSLDFTVTLTYTDGTTSQTTYTLYDWYGNPDQTEGYAQYRRNNGYTGTYGGPILQSKAIECDENKLLKSITFDINASSSVVNDKGYIYAGIYAVTGAVSVNAPEKPVAIETNEVGETSFTAKWEEVSGAEGYIVDVSEYKDFRDSNGNPSFVGTYNNYPVNGGVTSLKISGLEKNKNYYYRVRAKNTTGQSLSSNVISVKTVKHKHSWKYEESGNIVKAYCEKTSSDCLYHGASSAVTLVLETENMTYSGNLYNKATVTDNISLAMGGVALTADEIKYYDENRGPISIPKEVGTYTAKITIGGVTATSEFEIIQADISNTFNVALSSDSWVYGNSEVTPTITGNIAQAEVYYEYKKKNAGDETYVRASWAEIQKLPSENYTLRASVEENKNTSAASATCDFTITKSPISAAVEIADWTYGDNANTPDVVIKKENTDITSLYNKDNDVTYIYYTDSECNQMTTGANGAEVSGGVPAYAGTYYVKAAVAETENYQPVSSQPKTFQIAKKTISAIVAADDKEYDRNTKAIVTATVNTNELIHGDSISIEGLEGTFENANVGTNKKVTVSTTGREFAITGKNADNYDITFPSVAIATIYAKDIADDMIFINVKSKDNVEVIVSDASRLTEGQDYIVEQDLTSDPYVITVTGQGNYTGTIVRKITSVKTPVTADDSTVSTVVIEEGTENELKTSMSPVTKEDVKKLLDNNLTDTDVKDIINGTTKNSSYDTTVYLKKEEKSENDCTIEKSAIEKVIKAGKDLPVSAQIGKYVDLKLLMTYFVKSDQMEYTGTVQIDDAGEHTQSVTVTIPKSLKQTAAYTVRDYYVVRVAEENGNPIVKKVNSSVKGDQLTFTFDKSAVYAIVYKDTYYAPSYPVTGVKLSTDNITFTKKGETAQIKADITPSYADNKNITWKSSDEKVATVDENGKITAVGNGTATITATTVSGNYTATVTVTVNIPEEKPAIDKITMIPEKKTLTKIGESTQINLKIEPENADSSDLIWKSSDEKVAVVDKNGKVTAVGNGTVTITVSTKDGKYTTSITITVKVADEPTTDVTTGYGRLKARSVTQTNNSVKLEWTRVSGADGYIIYGNYCNGNGKTYKYNKITTITNGKTRTWTHTKLKKATYYKYIVKAYKLVNGKKVITDTSVSVHATTTGGKYGVAKAVSITKIGSKKNVTKVTLKKGKTVQITAKEIKKDKPIKHHRNICYESSNTKVATVTPDGVIQAKGKGTCTIWVYAQNGVYKTITVTVK